LTDPRIVVVGGGTIGLAIAEQLARRGARPTVLDRQAFAGEASWASSGFLDLRVASERGDAFFHLCRLSCEIYRDWTEALHRDTGIDPEYVHSRSLDLVFDDQDDEAVQALDRNLAHYGVHGEWLDGDEARRREPELSGELRRAFFLEHPAQVRPPRLNRALLTLLRDLGATLSEHTEVLGFQSEGREVRGVETTRGDFAADHVVLACGPWTSLVAGRLGVALPVRPIRGQALMINGHARLLRHILFGYNWYVVPRRDGRIFIGSTVEDVGFVKAATMFGMQKLTRLGIKTMPGLAAAPIEGSWSGLRPGTADGLPYLGLAPGFDNLWIASGHFTHGLVLSAATGRLMAQALLGERTDLDLEPFAPGRASTGGDAGAAGAALSFGVRAGVLVPPSAAAEPGVS
jgi:glycine oxidase